LGDSIKQAGSLVEEDRLRFDFQYDSKLSDAELNQIELLVNEYIQKDIPLETELTNLDDAISRGVLAFFEDKYGDNVRIVRFGNVSQELCGGTHINQTGKIGYFKIISEGSIGRGVRRISAITGNTAVEYIQGQIHILKEASLKLKVPSGELLTKLTSVLQTPKGQKNDFNQFTNEEIQQKIKETEKKRPYIIQKFELSSSLVRDEAIRVAEVIKGVVCFICYEGEKVHIIVATDKRISKQFNANIILQKILTYIDGKGGGQPHLAQGGGSNTNGVHKIEEDLGRIIDNL
jgi:alanyl-tRNA synthetase